MEDNAKNVENKFDYLYEYYDLAFEGLNSNVEKLKLDIKDDCNAMIKVYEQIRAQRKEFAHTKEFLKSKDLQELNMRLLSFQKLVRYILKHEFHIVEINVHKGNDRYEYIISP